jgi:uncharacterized protein (TIGR02284 family)
MSTQNEKVISVLNNLIEICHDGNLGYKHASEHIEHDDLETIFYRLSQQRALFEAELKDDVRHLGGTPDDSGTLSGTIHRFYLDVKAMFTGHDTEAIIETCKTGEKSAIEAYEKAIATEGIPAFIKERLTEQHKLIKGAVMQLEEFKKNPS